MSIVKRIRSTKYEDIPNGTLYPTDPAEDSEVIVIIDTGCSASLVPEAVLKQARTSLFPCAENRQLQEAADNDYELYSNGGQACFIVPDEQYENLYIRYRFKGRSAGSTVEVYGPADPFLCARNPEAYDQKFREGLLFPDSKALNTVLGNRWVFGMNFLHSMFAALHIPEMPSGAKPYVRFAPQRQSKESVLEYTLPPFPAT
ncbi:hypothetical protein TRAPUB_8536 [Trametes pubescens]|uniref:Peptidase A1 domain-containing protein n=1 Tax=Trametes pubescens TaxID=154538 RepID=A0A1M2W545_TRAPU|nr:hypothetical protein TRAPUB_8536 [Trametes pubescens]